LRHTNLAIKDMTYDISHMGRGSQCGGRGSVDERGFGNRREILLGLTPSPTLPARGRVLIEAVTRFRKIL
jgi:hypothetical protein